MGRVKELLYSDFLCCNTCNRTSFQPVAGKKKRLATSKKLPEVILDNQLLDYKQAAEYLQLSTVYLRRLKNKGAIPYVAASGKSIRFKVSSLNTWVSEREIKK